ncbi:rRNA maturation RNase YbeY [Bordetella sp. J329]|nr:rRNA maturation RNase YbeY [Bordetella sp. J329]
MTRSATPSPSRAATPALSLAVQYAVPETRLPRWRLRRWLQMALQEAAAAGAAGEIGAPEFQAASLTLRFVDAEEGHALNLEFRQRDYATNVLTFEYGTDPEGTAHGDIVICLEVLDREAAEQDKPFLAHAAHLTVHGALHALGYDHIDEDEAERMEALETRILGRMGLPDPYAPR